MKYSVFAIRDFKTGFLSPVCEANEAAAVRNFEAACLKSDSLFFSHPEDYALYLIGEYDTDSGLLTALSPIQECCTAPEAIRAALAHQFRSGGVSDAE